MYCTGGIRCDIYSAFLKSKGFNKMYTLEGGIQVGHRSVPEPKQMQQSSGECLIVCLWQQVEHSSIGRYCVLS